MVKMDSIVLKVLIVFALGLALPAPYAKALPDIKNEFGMYTVQCQAVENAAGNPVLGYVVGNHKKTPLDAQRDADLYTNKFNNAHKRHCYPQKRYRPSGAYDTNWNAM
ncbi:hypothetical protein [Corynebacterium sp.]|uniref:hypothetical protein n=1 Tax=Corynebacterium sp. TaxID=1720 RepID=UPI0026DB7207|nr:hypothetical protein [Corynebacterium sp.]MDO5031134.1 hypothetical protein [Corynebacterium sp.]